MSDDLSKVWGHAIHPGGMRPEGLENDCLILWSNNGKAWKEVHLCNVRVWGDCDNDVSIRLPVDHPYYRQSYKPTPTEHANGVYDPDCAACRSGGDAITLTADQAAMLRKVLAVIGGCVGTTIGHQTFFVPAQVVQDARGALALLPEPVDADLVEAREICLKQAIDEGCDEADMYHHYSKATVEGNASVRLAVTCIRRGRALERDSREG